jgi:hypothetical protein
MYVCIYIHVLIYLCMYMYSYVFNNEDTKAIWANNNVYKDISSRKDFAVKRSVSAVVMYVWAGAKINTTLP